MTPSAPGSRGGKLFPWPLPIALGLILTIFALVWLGMDREGTPDALVGNSALSSEEQEASRPSASGAGSLETVRAPALQDSVVENSLASGAEPMMRLQGRVLFADGRPAEGVGVICSATGLSGQSGSGGRFEMEIPEELLRASSSSLTIRFRSSSGRSPAS